MALKEVILSHTHSNDGIAKFKPFVDNIVPVLTDNAGSEFLSLSCQCYSVVCIPAAETHVAFAHTERKDEGVRSMVAECLGRLAIIDQDKLVPQMKKMATSGAGMKRPRQHIVLTRPPHLL